MGMVIINIIIIIIIFILIIIIMVNNDYDFCYGANNGNADDDAFQYYDSGGIFIASDLIITVTDY